LAGIAFYRVLPPSGYTKGLPAERRTDVGAGEIAPERRGVDFFPYKPPHLAASAPRPALARITNAVQQILVTGKVADIAALRAADARRARIKSEGGAPRARKGAALCPLARNRGIFANRA